MGLFRKRSTSSTTSTKLKRSQKNGTEISSPPTSFSVKTHPSSFSGPTSPAFSQNQTSPGLLVNNGGTGGLSTPNSQVSAQTNSMSLLAARSTAPSSIDSISVVGTSKFPGADGRTQGTVSEYEISPTSIPPDALAYVNYHQANSDFDSRQSNLTVTALSSTNQRSQQPSLPNNSSTAMLPQEWTDRDPSINTRFTHSPTPSESASLQSSIVFSTQVPPERQRPANNQRPPQLYPPHRPPHQQYYPNSASQRRPPQPLIPRASSQRNYPRMPPLPENSRASNHSTPRPRPPIPFLDERHRPEIPAIAGPRNLAIAFTQNQIACHVQHKNMREMKNFHHSVPCMVCRRLASDGMRYCTWCSLRICNECSVKLKKDWNGDVTKGWGGVESATSEFGPAMRDSNAKMVVGWVAQSPPVPARNAVNQLVWPTKTTTERVSNLLGIMYRPKTALTSANTHLASTQQDKFSHHHDLSFESALELESGASTVSPPSPVTPTAFATAPGSQFPMTLPAGKPDFDNSGYAFSGGYMPGPEIARDSTPELVHPRPTHYPVDADSLLKVDTKRSRAYSFDNVGLQRSETHQSNITVGQNSARPVTSSNNTVGKKDILAEVSKVQEKKKGKGGLKGLFSRS